MSLQTQAILPGHETAAEIALRLEQASGFRVLGYRTMRVPEHVLFELEDARGAVLCVDAFLNSWAADDYAAAYSKPSTLLSVEYSPIAARMLRQVAACDGLVRDNEMSDWGVATDARS
jgi:hypothetical protein